MTTRALALSLIAAAALLGCQQESTTTPTPSVIIETGYITCAAPAAGCDGAATCTDAEGQRACVEAPADACAGEATCACMGDWLCGDRACADTGDGFTCAEGAEPDAGMGGAGGGGGSGGEGGGAGACGVLEEGCAEASPCCDGLICSDAGTCQTPFVFGVQINNDVQTSIYVQLWAQDGTRPWLTVRRAGEPDPVQFLQECGPPDCDDPIVCEAPEDMLVDVTGGEFTGAHTLIWDRTLRTLEAGDGAQCVGPVPAPAGDYVATICFGGPVEFDDEATLRGRLTNPMCQEIPFSLPGDDQAIGGFSGG